MRDKKIRVALPYKKSYIFLTGKHFDNTTYHFFMHALKRCDRLDVTYFPCENDFDAFQLKDKFDVILLPGNSKIESPDNIAGIDKLDIPVVCRIGDPHDEKKYDRISYHEKYKINYYFNFIHERYFYKFYPRSFKFKTIIFGLEASLYQNITPFKDRIKDRILNSGVVARRALPYRIALKILDPHNNLWQFYKLRTMCNELPFVDHRIKNRNMGQSSDYPTYLSGYRAAIAATTSYPTIKYLEIPAAGCLTFMEITDANMGAYLGYKDGKTAVFINEDNYKEKFKEYLDSTDNPEWEKIANAGRSYALSELNNDKGAESLADLMEDLL